MKSRGMNVSVSPKWNGTGRAESTSTQPLSTSILEIPPIVEVEWLDACLQYNYDGPPATAGTLISMQRVGYLLGKKKDIESGKWYLLVCSECKPEDGTIREAMSIPWDWVLSIRELGDAPSKPQRKVATKATKKKKPSKGGK